VAYATNKVKCETTTVVCVKQNAGTGGGVAATPRGVVLFLFLYNAVLPPPEPGGFRLDGSLGLRPREFSAADRGDGVRGEAGRGGAGRGKAARWRAGSSSASACSATDTFSASASAPDSSEPDSSYRLSLSFSRT
jgi:hypothetical protein